MASLFHGMSSERAETSAGREGAIAGLRALLGPDAVVTEAHELARYEQGWRYGQGRALAAWGCDLFQGFLFYAPQPADELARALTGTAAAPSGRSLA